MSRLIRRGDLVFDIGAHTGSKAEVFLAEGARVVCVEPQPHCLAEPRRKLGGNRRLQTVAGGLGATAGSALLSTCTDSDVLSTFTEEWKQGRFAQFVWDQQLEVPMSTLDVLIERYGTPRYCKLDVEGFELDVLKGLSQPIPFLSFEFAIEFPDAAAACIRHLHALGYVGFNFSRADESRLALADWCTSDDILQWLHAEAKANPLAWGDIFATSLPDPSVSVLPPLRLGLLRRIVTRWTSL